MDEISKTCKALAEWIHEHYTRKIGQGPHNRYPYNTKTDGKVKRVVKQGDGYTCYFLDQYSIHFGAGRFGPGAKYSREPRTLSDTRILSVSSEDMINGSDVEQSETREVTKTKTVTKDISLEVAFRLLVSSSAEASIEFVKAGTKYEYELSTKLNTSYSETKTTETKVTKPIIIPPHSSLRYDVISEASTYRQRVHAEGIMDFNVTLDIYNVYNKYWDSIQDLQNVFTGNTGGENHWVYKYFRAYPIPITIPDKLLHSKLTMTIKTEDARSGRTSLTPI